MKFNFEKINHFMWGTKINISNNVHAALFHIMKAYKHQNIRSLCVKRVLRVTSSHQQFYCMEQSSKIASVHRNHDVSK